MSGLPPTDRTPIVSMYFSITMGVTTAATIMGVVILRIHHMGNRGIPVPLRLRALARLLAVITRSSYPDTERRLADLERGVYQSQAKDSYQYNVREYKNRIRKKSVKSKSSPPGLVRKMTSALPLPVGLARKVDKEQREKSQKAKNRWNVGIKKVVRINNVVTNIEKSGPSTKETWQRLIAKVLEENQRTKDEIQDRKNVGESEGLCFNIRMTG